MTPRGIPTGTSPRLSGFLTSLFILLLVGALMLPDSLIAHSRQTSSDQAGSDRPSAISTPPLAPSGSQRSTAGTRYRTPGTRTWVRLPAQTQATSLEYGQESVVGWRNASTESNISPPARYDANGGMVYDPIDGYILLFGGVNATGYELNDTWTYQQGSWTQLHPKLAPQAREYTSIAWDAIDGFAVLFGGWGAGFAYNDTWSFVHGNWTELHPTTSPSARWEESMAWDSGGGYVLLFGGCSADVQVNDTWSFSGGNWTEIQASSPPHGREAAGMAYDPTEGYMVLYGGLYWTTIVVPLNDTWAFNEGTWTPVEPMVSPGVRYSEGMVYDPSLGGTLLVRRVDRAAERIGWDVAPPAGRVVEPEHGAVARAAWRGGARSRPHDARYCPVRWGLPNGKRGYSIDLAILHAQLHGLRLVARGGRPARSLVECHSDQRRGTVFHQLGLR